MNRLSYFSWTYAFIFAGLFFVSSAHSQSLAIQHATVVDVTDGSLHTDQTVLIASNRITAIGAEIRVPEGAEVVDATGGYLIPGLWDMHTHIFNNNDPQPPNTWYFSLMLANGVTGVRDMFVKPGEQAEQVQTWRRALEAGTFIGPRIGAIGTLVDGTPPVHNSDTVSTFAEVQAFVKRVRSAGIDFVKVYSRLSPDVYRSLIEVATKEGLYVAGHVPNAVTATAASDAEQRSMEHLTEVFYDCSLQGDELRARGTPQYYIAGELSATYDPARCAALYERLARNETWQVPTTVAFRPWSTTHDLATLNQAEGLVHTPIWEAAEWQGLRDFHMFSPPPAKQGVADLFALQQRIVREMHEAGVPLLAGTDIGNPYLYPGFSLIDEVEEFVKAGLSPLAALQTATLNPARYLDRMDDLGTVEEGKLADLVLLDANPLEDIGNLRRIRTVVMNGRLFRRDALERMKYEVLVNNYREALARPPRLGVQLLEENNLLPYVGTYQREGRDAQAEVMLEEASLRVSFGDWIDSLEPLGGTLFRVLDSNVLYVFQMDDEGTVWRFEINDGSNVVRYHRSQ